MKLLPEPIVFEWDGGNTDKNLIKHNVTNKEAEEVFTDKENFVFEDKKHSQREVRYGLFGKTKHDRKLAIVFIIRNDKVRVITARAMSKPERRSYEKIKSDTKI